MNLSQCNKATGALADKYSPDDRLKISRYWFEAGCTSNFSTAYKMIRDGAMQKVAYALCLRGDNTRRLCLSDMQIHELEGTFNRPPLQVCQIDLISNI